MKKLMALGLSLAFLLSLSACQQSAVPADAHSSAVVQPADAQSSEPVNDPADASTATDPADSSLLLLPEGGSSDPGAESSAPPASEWEPEEEREPRTFGCSMPANPTLTQAAVAEQLKGYLEGIGDALVMADPADSAEVQRNRLKELAGQSVAAIFVCPVDGAALEEELTALSEQNIPVFGFGEWDWVPDGMVSIVRSDEYNAGYVCGIDLAERCPEGGDVLVLEQTASNAMMDRAQGFMDAAEESGVDLEIVDEMETEGSRDATAELVRKALKDDKDIVAIFATGDEDAAGALSAAKDTRVLVYSADGSPELKAQLGRSQLAGLGAQSPAGMAEALADNANQYLDGEAVSEENTVGTFLITEGNVKDYGVDGWQ